jgi:hypothetical protein
MKVISDERGFFRGELGFRADRFKCTNNKMLDYPSDNQAFMRLTSLPIVSGCTII